MAVLVNSSSAALEYHLLPAHTLRCHLILPARARTLTHPLYLDSLSPVPALVQVPLCTFLSSSLRPRVPVLVLVLRLQPVSSVPEDREPDLPLAHPPTPPQDFIGSKLRAREVPVAAAASESKQGG